MCDYSLEHYVSRSAKVGERLLTYMFPSLSAGMVGAWQGEPTLLSRAMRMLKYTGGDWDFGCAVCMEPGTELMFSKPIEQVSGGSLGYLAAKFVQLERHTAPHRNFAGEVLFRETFMIDGREVYERDAIETPDGLRYLLRDLLVAQVCTVVQLPAQTAGEFLTQETRLDVPKLAAKAIADEQDYERARVIAAIDAMYPGR